MEKNQQIYLNASPELVLVITMLRKFFNVSTNNKILPNILLAATFDISALPENPDWTEEQKTAWEDCKKVTTELRKIFSKKTGDKNGVAD